MKSRKILFCSLIMVMFSLICLTKVSAHDMWINARAYNLDPGGSVYVTIGYGHHYLIPGGEFMPKKYLDKIYLINPEGKRLKIRSINGIEYKSDVVIPHNPKTDKSRKTTFIQRSRQEYEITLKKAS